MDTAATAVRSLRDRGPGCVVLTLGKNGALFANREDSTLHHIKAPTVDVVDTTVRPAYYNPFHLCSGRCLRKELVMITYLTVTINCAYLV